MNIILVAVTLLLTFFSVSNMAMARKIQTNSSGFQGDSYIQRDVYVEGYYRKNGTYVRPHWRTAPDRTCQNNYSSKGNVNPYTGQAGTQNCR